ncbi:hypothetical protein [Pseudoxanthomonas indica]|nr:hypothetical protein [Pseudoxanthomonas indica]
MVVNTSAARRLRGPLPERRTNAVAHAGMFLWLAAAATFLAIGLSLMVGADDWLEEHCHNGTDAQRRIECTQHAVPGAGGEGQDVRHEPNSAGTTEPRA